MILKDAIEEFLVYLSAVRTLSDNTITGYRIDLTQLAGFVGEQKDVTQISKNDLLATIGEQSRQKKSAATINRYIAAVRTFFSYCKKYGYVGDNPALELKTVKIPKRIPRFMTSAEVNTLCDEPKNNELLWECRDKAIFEMLYSSGCRISELVSLKIEDFLNGYKSAIVRGKGKKDRYVYFGEEAQKSLKIYLDDRSKKFLDLNKEDTCPFVFVNQRGGALTTDGVRWILSRYSGPEGTNHHVSPHAFRHTFATTMLANGADVRVVQELLGHSSVSTTQRYTHITTEKLIEVYNKAHPHSD